MRRRSSIPIALVLALFVLPVGFRARSCPAEGPTATTSAPFGGSPTRSAWRPTPPVRPWAPEASSLDAGAVAECSAHHDAVAETIAARVCAPVAHRLLEAATRCCAGLPLEEEPAARFVEHCRSEALVLSYAAGCGGALDERAVTTTLDDFAFDCEHEWAWSPRWRALLGLAPEAPDEPTPVDPTQLGIRCVADEACGAGMVCDHGRACGREGPFYCMPRYCARPFFHLGPSHTCADECGP